MSRGIRVRILNMFISEDLRFFEVILVMVIGPHLIVSSINASETLMRPLHSGSPRLYSRRVIVRIHPCLWSRKQVRRAPLSKASTLTSRNRRTQFPKPARLRHGRHYKHLWLFLLLHLYTPISDFPISFISRVNSKCPVGRGEAKPRLSTPCIFDAWLLTSLLD